MLTTTWKKIEVGVNLWIIHRFLKCIWLPNTEYPNRIFGRRKIDKWINTNIRYNSTTYKEEIKFLSQAIKEPKCDWLTWGKVYTTEVDTTYYFSGLEKKPNKKTTTTGTMCITNEDRKTTSAASKVLFVKGERFLSLPCHVTKKDSWHQRVPQSLWQKKHFILSPNNLK